MYYRGTMCRCQEILAEDFDYWVGAQEISKYYFEDKMDPSLEICAVERRQED